MGILDDLKSQAEQKNKPAGEQAAPEGAEEFYRSQVKPRMVMAYDFLTQLVNQLDALKLVIKAEYPFKPEGKNVTLLQKGYKAYSDHITDPRQLTLSFICILANPTTYDVKGRAPALAQGELLERYQFKYKKLEARDQNQMVSGARFVLQGPLQVKCVLQFDEDKQIIKLLLTNIVGHGTSQYNLKPEQLDETFMDHLGKYLLRKEANLFQEEISDDVKAMLRKKLQQEQLQREAELRAVEEQRKTEEMARKQSSTTQQLKRVVSQSVAENREKLKKVMDEQVREKGEKLKSMFNRLKSRVATDSPPEQTSATPAGGVHPAAKPMGNPAAQDQPPVDQPRRAVSAPRANATRPKPPVEQKKPAPPRVFQSSATNPFLKPEDFEPVPKAKEAQPQAPTKDTMSPATQKTAQITRPVTAPSPTATLSSDSAKAQHAAVARTAGPNTSGKPVAVQARAKTPMPVSPVRSATASSPPKSPVQPAGKPVAPPPVPSAVRPAGTPVGTPKPTPPTPAQLAVPAAQMPTRTPAIEAKPASTNSVPAAESANREIQPQQPRIPADAGLSLEPIAAEDQTALATVSGEGGLSLEPVSAKTETKLASSLDEQVATPAPEAAGLSLEPITPEPDAPASVVSNEPELSLEPRVSNAEASSSQVSDVSDLSQVQETVLPSTRELNEPDLSLESEITEVNTSTPEVPADPVLSLEEQLEADLARITESYQQERSIEGKTTEEPDLISGELDLDLSDPDALQIHFDDANKASE